MNIQKFGIQFDFDHKDEPPKVYIADNGGRGTAYLEVFEEPKLLFNPNDRKLPWDHDDWQAGKLAMEIVDFMNSRNEDE